MEFYKKFAQRNRKQHSDKMFIGNIFAFNSTPRSRTVSCLDDHSNFLVSSPESTVSFLKSLLSVPELDDVTKISF